MQKAVENRQDCQGEAALRLAQARLSTRSSISDSCFSNAKFFGGNSFSAGSISMSAPAAAGSAAAPVAQQSPAKQNNEATPNDESPSLSPAEFFKAKQELVAEVRCVLLHFAGKDGDGKHGIFKTLIDQYESSKGLVEIQSLGVQDWIVSVKDKCATLRAKLANTASWKVSEFPQIKARVHSVGPK